MDIDQTENLFAEKVMATLNTEDPAHDDLHVERVVAMAKKLCVEEDAMWEVVAPAAWLHDLVPIPKNDPRRRQASRLSAEAAVKFLREIEYPEEYHAPIFHAIEAHSFSAQVQPETLEAKIVQDADRLDGLGAIGVARCFATAGVLKRPFYSKTDPFGVTRELNDNCFTLDHFYVKLFKVSETLNTRSGKLEGKRRAEVMRSFLSDLELEIP